MHEWLLSLYVAAVSEKHERADTSVSYARNVAKEWLRIHGTVLWPNPMFAELHEVTDGLAKIKDFSKRQREGFSAADVAILVRTVHKWARDGKRVGKGQARWDNRLASTVAALMIFCFQKLYRMGDATCPDGEDYNADERFSRASVWFSENIAGTPREMTLDPPVNKCANRFTGHPISDAFTDECTNWPSAIDNMLSADPVPHHQRHETPLFRDTRTSKRRADGTFQAGGLPIGGAFMRRTIRALVKANVGWFGARLPALFGLHSFRIGGLNAALDAGATYMECCALGRWVSTSVIAYHRMPKAKAHDWQRRVARSSEEEIRAEMTKQGYSLATIAKRLGMLKAAKSTPSQYTRTHRVAVPRTSTISGFAIAKKQAKQSTLSAWRIFSSKE